ncbi:universal stress protein A-like protein-like isoform X1 [Hibiscus syriacus]|uniref:Universal stress protein A-like protein-like isoform X1 n=1 Tax=Hibiscus syriacus TaxID=106335 RepID=A0A6A3ALA1_HIBSY|nr:uncharacterized protein LOC120127308 [Hibiscus syriacus]KAE8703582.1 universal stress protein A-like protein-like isoform X1 [Hibiscus syriacus]
MGNYFSAVICGPSDTSGKVILWDGSIQQFSCPLTAAELMLEYPQQVVAEFHAAVNGKRPVPLPADEKLDVKKVYVMLPVNRGKPITLSSEDARRVLASANAVLRSKSILSFSSLLPLFARICHVNHMQETGQKYPFQEKGTVRERVEEIGCLTELLPERMEGLPEYFNRQYSGKGWKPSLDTIKEKKFERKVSHWLY